MAVSTVKVTLNGQEYTLTLNSSSGKYEATITAPSTTSWGQTDNKYGLVLKATDTAGNMVTKDRTDQTLGSNLAIRVLEKDKPTVVITSPSTGARVTTSTPKIVFQLRDSGSGINISSLSFRINSTNVPYNGTGMKTTAVSGGYDCEYTPQSALPDGAQTVTISIGDNDGNTSTAVTSNFIVDTVPPSLNVTNPTNGSIVSTPSINVTGTTDDVSSKPITVTIVVNGTDAGEVTINGTSFTKEVTLKEGANTIVVTATDGAGLSSSVTRTITLDTKAPVISDVVLSANTVDAGRTFTITVTVTD